MSNYQGQRWWDRPMTDQERRAVELRLARPDQSQTWIAAQLGCGKARVSQLLLRGLAKRARVVG